MAKQTINLGSGPDSYTGDSLNVAFTKINENFTDLYSGNAAGNIRASGNIIANTSLRTDGFIRGQSLEIIANAVVLGTISANNFTYSNGVALGDFSNSNINTSGNISGNNLTANILYADTGDFVDLLVSGNLTVNGNTTFVDVTRTTIEDPLIEIGGNAAGTALTSNDTKDRGLILHYYNGAARDAFIGWDNSSSEIRIASNAIVVNNEVLLWDTYANVRAGNFIGNGSQLTGITSYTNANVISYAQTGWAGNIIPNANATYSLGSETNQWANLWVANNTIYIGGVPLGINTDNVLTINGEPLLSNDSTTSITTSGNISASEISGTSAVLGNLKLTNQAAPLDIWMGPEIYFTKTDYGEEVDAIDANLALTRGNNQGLYNSAIEFGWDDTNGDPDGRASPKGTLWNDDGWADLTNLDQRTYETFYNTMGGGIGNNVLPRQFIMKDVANNTYYKIDFSVWGNNSNGAPVTYTRQQVDPVDGSDIGSLVTFTKEAYADPFLVFDNISTQVKISRANNQSIFNIVSEQGYNGNSPGDGDGENSPQGTEWNIDGWLDLTDVKQRTYKPFVEIFDWNLGERIVGTECVMHDTINDTYWAIKFTQWTGGSNGGGFSYIRRRINADAVFVHTENGDEVDDITEGVGITRDSDGAIYNPYDEGSWDQDVSPGGTEWNFDGNHDLSDVQTRIYKPFYEAVQFGGIGNKIEGKEAVMRVTSTGDYYTIKFLHWQQGGGGAFSYIRTEIDLDQINEGIRFADGTVQKTAADGRVKFKGPLGRRIEEYYGYEEVDITPAQEYTLDTTMRGNYNDTDYVQLNVPDEQTALQLNNGIMRNTSISFDNGVTWIPLRGNSGGYGNYPPGSWYTSIYTLNNQRISYTDGQSVKLKYWRNGEPKLWFNPEKSPGGDGNFRGAIIDYHAYCDNAGTIIGQIIVSRDSGDYHVTHTESTSGSSDLPQVVLWHSFQSDSDYVSGEGKLYAYRVDGDNDTIKIQWKATMFYGTEFWD